LDYSEEKILTLEENQAASALVPSLQDRFGQISDDSDSKVEESYLSIYNLLLSNPYEQNDQTLGVNVSRLPIKLIFTRFFRYHTSFYELEILNKSIIKSYVVLLEANVY
jgi:hypothetical protein